MRQIKIIELGTCAASQITPLTPLPLDGYNIVTISYEIDGKKKYLLRQMEISKGEIKQAKKFAKDDAIQYSDKEPTHIFIFYNF